MEIEGLWFEVKPGIKYESLFEKYLKQKGLVEWLQW
jgi:hypothetical protein